MKLIKCVCPNCNAELQINDTDNNLGYVRCQYCDSVVFIDNESDNEFTYNYNINSNATTTHTYKKIDVARINENKSREKLATMRIEKDIQDKRKNDRMILISFLILILVVATPLLIYFRPISNDEIRMNCNADDYIGRSYDVVIKELKAMGFINIETIPKEDLINGWITKENSIDTISIKGNFKFSENTVFKKTDKVIITYHSFKNDNGG